MSSFYRSPLRSKSNPNATEMQFFADRHPARVRFCTNGTLSYQAHPDARWIHRLHSLSGDQYLALPRKLRDAVIEWEFSLGRSLVEGSPKRQEVWHA